jgi:hypothetical protein
MPAARRDRGSVTAETALTMPAVVVVLAALLGTGQVLLTQVRCVDAARAGARAAARGEPDTSVQAMAAGLVPAGAPIEVRRGDGMVRVGVSVAVRVPLPVPPIPCHCVAVAAEEPS